MKKAKIGFFKFTGFIKKTSKFGSLTKNIAFEIAMFSHIVILYQLNSRR